MANATDKSLESWIWDAACSIRGAKDAPKFKDYILPLIFTKRLCDVFDDELNRIAKEVGSRAKAFKLVAKRSDTASSDIDVLVLSDHVDYADVFEALQSADAKRGRTVNPTVQKPADWRRKRKAGVAFVVKVTAQPKLFLIGSEEALG